jgi:hypothetical protein
LISFAAMRALARCEGRSAGRNGDGPVHADFDGIPEGASLSAWLLAGEEFVEAGALDSGVEAAPPLQAARVRIIMTDSASAKTFLDIMFPSFSLASYIPTPLPSVVLD